MSKKFISVVCIILAFLMLFGILASVLASTVGAVSQSEIDALEKQRSEIRSKQADVIEQLDSLREDMASALEKKTALDEQNDLNRQDIELINDQIDLYDQMIQQKSDELDDAKAAEEQQYKRYRERVRAMEENGSWSYISFIFRATSIADLLARIDDVMDIMSHDQDLEAEYVKAREHVEEVKAEYESVQEEQLKKKDELEEEKAQLESQIEAACAMIADLEGDIDTYTAFYNENAALEADVQSKIDEKVAQLKKEEAARAAAAAAAAAANSNKGNSSGGTKTYTSSSGFYWPCQSSTYITSRFGYRVHPIFNTTKFHSGVDIAANSGATISAAAGGTVAIAEYSSSYGNYVVIYHDNGTTTLYAHMSSMAVKAGDSVSQGQTIGYVGSTGNSTGPHLHFEVRVNGSCVDPMGYFSLTVSYASDA